MKVRTSVKAGGIRLGNHNETLVRDRAKGLRVRTNAKAGGHNLNHNEALVRERASRLKVKTRIKSGIIADLIG
jgi:hypothetical protein